LKLPDAAVLPEKSIVNEILELFGWLEIEQLVPDKLRIICLICPIEISVPQPDAQVGLVLPPQFEEHIDF